MSDTIPLMYTDNEDKEELRIVLVGKTGVGKSSSGNTILDDKVFKAEISSSTVTQKCKRESRNIGGRCITVVDTPGLYDSNVSHEKLTEEIVRSISMMAPGPHVFLVVIQLGRFTEEERETVELIKEMFGKEASSYTMVLFTRADELQASNGKTKSLKEFLKGSYKGSCQLRQMLKTYGNNYHAFDNNSMNDRAQVRELLEKIDTKILKKNKGGYYTNDMLQEAEKAIKKTMEKILKKKKGQIQEKVEELEKQYKGEELQEKKNDLWREERRKAREEAQRDNEFINNVLISLGIIVVAVAAGAATGGAASTAVVGLGVAEMIGMGAGAGAAVGSLAAAGRKIKDTASRCSLQ